MKIFAYGIVTKKGELEHSEIRYLIFKHKQIAKAWAKRWKALGLKRKSREYQVVKIKIESI